MCFLTTITQSALTPCQPQGDEETNQHRTRKLKRQATQACKQRWWLPLRLCVPLTALLIHLGDKRHKGTDPTPLSTSVLIYQHMYFISVRLFVKPRVLLWKRLIVVRSFEAKGKKLGPFLGQWDYAAVGVIFHGVFSLVLKISLTKVSLALTNIHSTSAHRRRDKMAE